MTAASGWAVQIQGATRTRIVNNTVWGNGIGGVIVRRGPGTGTVPTDTVVANNIFDSLGWMEGARPALQTANVLGRKPSVRGEGDVNSGDAGLDGNLRPMAGSPARGLARADLAPLDDLTGRRRPGASSAGALE
jgi:hypothetical protein